MSDGAFPGDLIRNHKGIIYGTAGSGAAGGTVFKLDRSANLTVIHRFSGSVEGAWPHLLTLDSENNLYGVTVMGGTSIECGTVFKVDPAGNHTILFNFHCTDGKYHFTHLLQDANGNLYGGTYGGGRGSLFGENGAGVVFKLDPFGQYSVLHYFTSVPDGERVTNLLRDNQGNLYGTTAFGGNLEPPPFDFVGYGTIFKLDPEGHETVLYRFNGTDGAYPFPAGLISDATGNLYGTTTQGGAYGNGVIYKLDTAGSLEVLHNFTGGSDGQSPRGLIWGRAGRLYGTTEYGGAHGYGVVYELARNGTLTVLHNFTGAVGGASPTTLLLGQGNVIYGTTTYGGITGGVCETQGCGTIFSIKP